MSLQEKNIFKFNGTLSDTQFEFEVTVFSNVLNPGTTVSLTFDDTVFSVNTTESVFPKGSYDTNTKIWTFDINAYEELSATIVFDFTPAAVTVADYNFSAQVTGLDTNPNNNLAEGVVHYKSISSAPTGATYPAFGHAGFIDFSEYTNHPFDLVVRYELNSVQNGVQEHNEGSKYWFSYDDPHTDITGSWDFYVEDSSNNEVLVSSGEDFTIFKLINTDRNNLASAECVNESYTSLEECASCDDPKDKVTFSFNQNPKEGDLYIANFLVDGMTVYYTYTNGEWVETCKAPGVEDFVQNLMVPDTCRLVYHFTKAGENIYKYTDGEPYMGDVEILVPYDPECGQNAGVE